MEVVVVVEVEGEGVPLIFIFECGWGGKEALSGADPFNPPEVDIISPFLYLPPSLLFFLLLFIQCDKPPRSLSEIASHCLL